MPTSAARQLIAALALALLWLLPLTARASDDPWADHPGASSARELASRYQVQLISPARWQAQEAEDLLLAAKAMPDALWRAAGAGPWRVERVRRACLDGVGRYTKPCPTFSEDGRTFYIYNAPPMQGEVGPTRDESVLNAHERVRLLRQRALVHMVMARVDQAKRWSARQDWRLINGWDGREGAPAFNVDAWGYSRYLGMQSEHLDLVTFAEVFFVRAEDILRVSQSPDAPTRLAAMDVNIGIGCQKFSQVRVLSRRLSELDPAWREPLRGVAAREGRPVDVLEACPQFALWAGMEHVEGVDLLLAAATSDRPESLYGHLLMQVRYKSGATVRSQGFEPVYQYGAITDSNVSKVDYFTKGLFGGFYGVIQVNTFRGTDRLFLQYEQRSLRRYAFNLNQQQLLQVMQRIWEAERHITYPYFFMSDNCATMLIDVLAPALDVALPDPWRFAMMPTEVLDLFASVQSGDRGSLLIKRAETHFSSREVAMDAVGERRAALAALRAAVGSADQRARLSALDERLDAREAELRRDAYRELSALMSEVLQGRASGASDPVIKRAIDYLYYCSRIERYFMDIAFYRERMIQAYAARVPQVMTAQQQLDLRRELFAIEDLMARQEALLAWARQTDVRLREGERRPYTQEEQAELAKLGLMREAYLASLDALAETIEAFAPDLDGMAYLDAKQITFEREQTRRDRLAMGPAGKGQFVLGGAVAQDGQGSALAGVFDVSASMIHERLGEQRRRGFRSDIESRGIGLDARLRLDEDVLDNLVMDLVLFRFLTLEQRMGPVRESWRDVFGWGMDIRLSHDGRRDLRFGIGAKGGYLYPIWTRDNISSFLVVGALLEGRLDWGGAAGPTMLGAQGLLMGQLHLYGRYANVLRASVTTSQLGALDELRHRWDLTARLSIDQALFEASSQQLLIARPYAELELSTMDYRRAEPAQFRAWRAGLLFELPF